MAWRLTVRRLRTELSQSQPEEGAVASRFGHLREVLRQHGAGSDELTAFETWERAARADPERLRLSDSDVAEYQANRDAVAVSLLEQPHSGNREQENRVKAAKRKTEKLAWLYE